MNLRPIHRWVANNIGMDILEPPLDENDENLVRIHQKWQDDMKKLEQSVDEYENIFFSSLLYKIENDQQFKENLKKLLQ